MKQFCLAALLLLTPLSARAETAEFNLKEPITLSLKDASLTEVVTLLGALANVPVSIAPEVQGTVSIEVVDVPYERVLQILGQENALWIRIEGGKLVATTLKAGASGAAPASGRPLSGPRLAVDEYAKASGGGDRLFVGVRTANGVRCVHLPPEAGKVEISVPGAASPALVSQFGRDPVSGTKFVAVEYPGVPPRAVALREEGLINKEIRGEDGRSGLSILSIPVNGASCPDAILSPFQGDQRMIRLEVREGADGTGAVLAAAQIQATAGWPFATVTGVLEDSGQHREIHLNGYFSADGRSVAAVVVAVATWTDSSDGREYVYSQISSARDIGLVVLTNEEQVAASLPAGSALEKGLQLKVRLVPPPAK